MSSPNEFSADRLEPAAGEPLPWIFQRWLGQLLGGPIPRESRATCNSCAMCVTARKAEIQFRPDVKCCSYVPDLPNFLVGRILSSEGQDTVEGVTSVERRIRSGVGVGPLGLEKSAQYALLYRNAASQAFGRASELRCPHYVNRDGGLCGIWSSRNSVCATWFCKHERGAAGQSFWRDTKELLQEIELQLRIWCVQRSGFDADSIRLMLQRGFSGSVTALVDEVTGVPPDGGRQNLWGAWCNREPEFFRGCWLLVRDLKWDDVYRICGPRVQVLASALKCAQDRMKTSTLPSNLTFRRVSAGPSGDPEKLLVATYSPFDPLTLERDVWLTLTYFDGRPQREVRDEIERREGLVLDDELVAALVDYEILGPPEIDVLAVSVGNAVGSSIDPPQNDGRSVPGNDRPDV